MTNKTATGFLDNIDAARDKHEANLRLAQERMKAASLPGASVKPAPTGYQMVVISESDHRRYMAQLSDLGRYPSAWLVRHRGLKKRPTRRLIMEWEW